MALSSLSLGGGSVLLTSDIAGGMGRAVICSEDAP
jgi:hypothetical protein